jgi:hypothetical protein
MTRFDKFCLLVALLVTITCVRSSLVAFKAYGLAGLALLVVWIGWLIATYGSLLAATAFRHWKSHRRPRWPLHILFAFTADAAFLLGTRIMLQVIGVPDFDATLGGPAVPGALSLFAAVAGYAISVLSEVVSERRLRRG